MSLKLVDGPFLLQKAKSENEWPRRSGPCALLWSATRSDQGCNLAWSKRTGEAGIWP